MALTSRTNPVLAAYRERGGDNPDAWLTATYAFEMFGGYIEWNDVRSYFHGIIGATGAQLRHARRVFRRLVVLEASGDA